MKVMILAAGRGSRMGALTLNTPKPLVQVSGKPLIQYHLENLEKAGFKDVVINISWLAEKLRNYLENEYNGPLNIVISYEVQALETGGGIYFALNQLNKNNEPFLVINSDVMTDFDYSLIKTDMEGLAHLYMVDNPEHNLKGDYCLNKSGLLLPKTLENTIDTVTFSGISVLSPLLFNDCRLNKFSLVALFNKYINSQEISAEMLSAKWFDVGTIERLEKASRWKKNIINL